MTFVITENLHFLRDFLRQVTTPGHRGRRDGRTASRAVYCGQKNCYAESKANTGGAIADGKGRCFVTREELLERISIDPKVCFGKPCIRGRRIWVSLVLDLLAGGMKAEEVMTEYDLTEADIRACIAYGAEMSRERYVDLPTGTEG